jgi:hypothetical protein
VGSSPPFLLELPESHGFFFSPRLNDFEFSLLTILTDSGNLIMQPKKTASGIGIPILADTPPPLFMMCGFFCAHIPAHSLGGLGREPKGSPFQNRYANLLSPPFFI